MKKIPLYTYGNVLERTREWIEELGLPKGSKALDVPSGAGALAKIMLEEWGFETYASDIDLKKYEYEGINCVQADLGNRLPFEDNFFDLTVCMEGLKHLSNLSQAISELRRVTKPNGYILLTIPNDLCMQSRFNYLWGGYVDTDWRHYLPVDHEQIKLFFYINSLVHFPYLFHFLEKNNLEFLGTRVSRLRVLSVILAVVFFPIIYYKTRKAVKNQPTLLREMLSLNWLAGRHNVILCRKK